MIERVRAVALHDVEPRSFNECIRIRDWLIERGVEKVTLLVIPARGFHSFARRSPALHDWLYDRVTEGDAVAQHGLMHDRGVRRSTLRREFAARLQGGQAAEFVGLSERSTCERVRTGRAILRDAGFDARGFVAPAYAYTPALRDYLRREFDWYADLLRVYGAFAGTTTAPAWCLGSRGILRRPLSPLAARGMASLSRSVVRIDVHPSDFAYRGHKRALDRIVGTTADLPAVVYDELVGS
jgi:predicted deacetylase